MRKIVIMLSVILVFGGIYFLLNTSQVPQTNIASAPYVKIDTLVRLSGLKDNVPVRFTLAYQNVSKDTIQIRYVETFCGCLQCDYSRDKIAPKDTASLKMTFKPQYTGHMEREFYIYFQNKPEPVVITLKGFVK